MQFYDACLAQQLLPNLGEQPWPWTVPKLNPGHHKATLCFGIRSETALVRSLPTLERRFDAFVCQDVFHRLSDPSKVSEVVGRSGLGNTHMLAQTPCSAL